MLEISDDLIRKMKKDPNNVALQNSKLLEFLCLMKKVILKKKKVEQDLQARKASLGPVTKSARSAYKNLLM